MMGIFDWLPWLLGSVITIGLALLGFRSGKNSAEAKADKQALKTIKEIEDAKDRAAAGGGDWRQRLRETDKR